MNEGRKKQIGLLIIYSSIFLVALIGATFAYFTATASGGTSTVTLESSVLGSAYADGTSVLLEVTDDDMQKNEGTNDYSKYKDSSYPGTLTITTSTGNTLPLMTCTYDLRYVVSTPYLASAENTMGLKELTINGYQKVTTGDDNVSVSGSMSEVDLTNVNEYKTLVSGAKLIVNGVNSIGTTTWYFTPRFYNLGINQDDNANKIFSGNIEVASLACINTKS